MMECVLQCGLTTWCDCCLGKTFANPLTLYMYQSYYSYLFIPSQLISQLNRDDTWNFEPFISLALASPQNSWSSREKHNLPWFIKIQTVTIFAIPKKRASPHIETKNYWLDFPSKVPRQDGWWSEAADDELPTMQCTYAFEQPFGGEFVETQTPRWAWFYKDGLTIHSNV